MTKDYLCVHGNLQDQAKMLLTDGENPPKKERLIFISACPCTKSRAYLEEELCQSDPAQPASV